MVSKAEFRTTFRLRAVAYSFSALKVEIDSFGYFRPVRRGRSDSGFVASLRTKCINREGIYGVMGASFRIIL